MPARIRLRELTPEERLDLEDLARSRTTPIRLVERAGSSWPPPRAVGSVRSPRS